jgi:ATP-dependent Lhr-like helicase
MPISAFSQATREWFTRTFEAPTPAQAQAWPAIASGDHVLISAPTGSGKTLAAFLWSLDRLATSPRTDGDGVRVVYVSPLKALGYDIERNLRAPLAGLVAHGAPEIRVALRTGDTPQRERAAIRRNPPDILITTPESLYLMLTSQAREVLRDVEAVIIDEIHAVASTKRGAHLALTLERLSAQVRDEHDREPQRIGLSATQNPLSEVARFMVGPRRTCTIVDVGARKELDLRIQVPVESMADPEPPEDELDPVPGGGPTRASIWPAMYPRILELVRAHRSTIVFVNARRAAERLAMRLNELAAEEDGDDGKVIARAHHGSLAREERLAVEEELKSGRLPCLVATSSLELGIDMGAVDLVIQVESPKSVARGLQRIGRAGHGVGDVSRGRIFPKFRADLLECAVVVKLMREGRIEPTVVPRNALDVLCQQIVAIAASAEDDEPLRVDDLYDLVTRTYSYADLSRELLENVLDMLDGRYPSEAFAELRPRIVWDRAAGTIRARKGARRLAVTNAGTIPDRGLYQVVLPDGRRVGELDEEMVYEARPGQVFLLGASSWRIEDIERDRVIVTPAPGVPGAVPFWRGDTVGRPKELGREIGAFARWAVDQDENTLVERYDLDPSAARNLIEFLREQQAATRVVPSDRAIVVERFRDEIGDWRLAVLSPYGGRVHAAWALAASAKIRDELGLEADAIWSDDGIVMHLPDADAINAAEVADLVLIDPDELEDLVVAELGGSALFGARFRENAGRALLIPRARPGRRTPLWQQRLKAQSLLEVAREFRDFPIVLETYRECLRDVLDVPGLRDLLAALHRRDISLVEVETPTASPFASSLLFDYVATYMYEGDTPNAERRAAALSLDRDLLRELLGQDELRDLLDADALQMVEDDLQHRSPRTRAADRDQLVDVLRRVGDLTLTEVRERVVEGVDAEALLARLADERRAVAVRIAGEERWIAADDSALYRDALGANPPSGLPAAFLDPVEDAAERLVARWARTHGPFTTGELRERYGIDLTPALKALEADGRLVRGELRPGGTEREWCDPDVLRRIRRASLAALRKEIEATEQRTLAAFLPSWQGVDRWTGAAAGPVPGPDRLREALVPLQGLALPADVWERDVLPRRCGDYSPTWMDQLCAAGEVVWVGSGALGRGSGRVALYFREDAWTIGPPWPRPTAERPSEPEHEALRRMLAEGPAFFGDLQAELGIEPAELQEALWDLVWAGEVTNDAFAPLRAPRLTLARTRAADLARRRRRAGTRFSARRGAGSAPHLQGRWSLTAPLFDSGGEVDEAGRRRAVAELLLERYGVLTREHVIAEGVPGGFAALYPELSNLETLGVCRRGYFVEGLGGAQFALPGAVERLRAAAEHAEEAEPIVLAATDPAQAYGAALPWPVRDGDPAGRRRGPARAAGAYVVLAGAEPVLYVERGGRALLTLVDRDDPRLRPALEALAAFVTADGRHKLALERVDGEPVIGCELEELLIEVGFRAGPRKLTLSA